MKRVGRREPYTAIGIRRLKCQRCKKRPAHASWNCCANDNRHVPLCVECDIALNRLAMDFFRIPGRRPLMRRYENHLKSKGLS